MATLTLNQHLTVGLPIPVLCGDGGRGELQWLLNTPRLKYPFSSLQNFASFFFKNQQSQLQNHFAYFRRIFVSEGGKSPPHNSICEILDLPWGVRRWDVVWRKEYFLCGLFSRSPLLFLRSGGGGMKHSLNLTVLVLPLF